MRESEFDSRDEERPQDEQEQYDSAARGLLLDVVVYSGIPVVAAGDVLDGQALPS